MWSFSRAGSKGHFSARSIPFVRIDDGVEFGAECRKVVRAGHKEEGRGVGPAQGVKRISRFPLLSLHQIGDETNPGMAHPRPFAPALGPDLEVLHLLCLLR